MTSRRYYHTRINGKLRAVWDDGTITLPIIRGGDEGEESNPPADPPKTFTADEVNRIVQERVARTKTELPEDYAELQEAKKRLDEIEAANSTELEKAQRLVSDKDAEIARLAAENNEFKAKELTRQQREQIKAAAKDAVDPDVVADLLLARNAVTIDDAGQVTNAESAVKALLDSTPALAAAPQPPQRMGAGVGRGGGTDTGSVAEARERYRERRGKNNP